jgi:hypothetical protein
MDCLCMRAHPLKMPRKILNNALMDCLCLRAHPLKCRLKLNNALMDCLCMRALRTR